MSCEIARDDWLEDVRVADLANAAHRVLAFEPVHGGLNRRVGRTRFWKCLLNLADGCFPLRPQRFKDLKLEPREPWSPHARLL